MKRVITALCASALLATSPAWAHDGHGHDKHDDKYAEKAWKHERKAWEKEQKYWAKHGGYYDRGYAYYYPAPPVVERYYVAPAPYVPPSGAQVVFSFPLN